MSYLKVFSCYNKNEDIRMKSSSGGIFYLLAEQVIERGGVVFGAGFDKSWNVVHSYCDTLEGIKAYMTSKYVQSSMQDTFHSVKKFVEAGRLVLFSGTPCQVTALNNYLSKQYTNLILVDFICHGVPSPLVWKKYLEERAQGRNITDVSFRDKTEGWTEFSLKIGFEDGSEYRMNQHTDVYMKSFLQNFNLRPSCYKCRFKLLNRISDFTLADFWGAKEVMPEMFDDKGVSLLLVHSEKCLPLIKNMESQLIIKEIPSKIVLETNTNAVHSVAEPDNRKAFFENTDGSMVKRLEKFTHVSIITKVKRRLKRLVNKG